ncbi:MAG TPA: amidohydrolase family protein [Methylomirabilota bacterium]|jgi:N-acyl-D-aspartate/D-glutamate deacylase|nr:amidohydrolase family protein [Methylomirabilota bacterium]
MTYDLLIRNGTVVDGTGAPRFRADVAVHDGRIVEVGAIRGSARQTIDASDLIVAPGFIDPHTHYDAQIDWDPLVTCSSWHGVTSVVMGNCGVGLAPCRPEQREALAWDLVNVEGMSFNVLSKGVLWEWESFSDFMTAKRKGLGINLGFLMPLSPFRSYVIGEAAQERAATPSETERIAALIRDGMRAGALGFSTTVATQHVGHQGRPLACRLASREELGAYARALRDLGYGSIEVNMGGAGSSFLPAGSTELLDFLLTESRRPVTWLSVQTRSDQPTAHRELLSNMDSLIKRGGIPQASCQPTEIQFNLRNPFIFGPYEVCHKLFNRSVAEQTRVYADPAFRAAFRDAYTRSPKAFGGQWARIEVCKVQHPAHRSWVGKTIGALSAQEGKDPLDTFFDLAIADELGTEFTLAMLNFDPPLLQEVITDSRVLIGLSDGGAHVDMLCNTGYPTYLLGTWVRERQVMSLERAVQRLTAEPAQFFGLYDRGVIARGKAADLVIFDPRTVAAGDKEMLYDLPGGEGRFVQRAEGVHWVIVNGAVLFADGAHSGALPGQVLRAGRAA